MPRRLRDRWRRFTSTSATTTTPSDMPVTPSVCSRVARTICTRSARHSSFSVARCWSAAGWTRPSSGSAPPTRASACGGSGASSRGGGQPAAGTLEALYRAPGQDVAIVPGTSDYAPGRVRVSFLVVDAQGRAILRPTARVWLARGLDAKPFEHAIARQEALSAAGASEGDVQAIYVTHLLVPSPGKYWLLAEPVGGRRIQA